MDKLSKLFGLKQSSNKSNKPEMSKVYEDIDEPLRSEKYKVVTIQQLTPAKTNTPPKSDTNDHIKNWIVNQCTCENKYRDCKCKSLYYLESGPSNVRNYCNHFFGAFLQAYNNHEGIILNPNDIWLCICLQFSKYVAKNSEKLRTLLVKHAAGKEPVTVTTWKETSENEWQEFFDLIIEAIKQKTVVDSEGVNVVDFLSSDFSVTGPIDKILSTCVLMDTMKHYFDYGRCIPCCGITHVKFMGNRKDWIRLLKKTTAMKKFDVDSQWNSYISGIEPIIMKFIDTYDENVDLDWWNRIMDIQLASLGSGSTQKVSGWILAFFGLNERVDIDEITQNVINVPIKIDNKLTGIVKIVNLVGGFGGVGKEDGAYCPRMSVCIIEPGKQ